MKITYRRILIIVIFLLLSHNLFASVPTTDKGMWIWKIWETESGNLNAIITKLKSSGVEWVVIKLGDSNSYYNMGGKLLYNWASHYQGFNNIISQFHNNGIKVFGWHFVYSYSKWNTGNDESTVSNQILDIQGIDGLVINAETDYEGQNKGNIASQYLKNIRQNHPSRFIAYSSFARVTGHEWFPWLEFGKYSDVNMPHAYWAVRLLTPNQEINAMQNDFNNWAITWQNNGHGSSIKPIIPLGQGGYMADLGGNSLNAGDITTFSNTLKNNNFQGVSLFRYNIMNQNVWTEYGASWGQTQSGFASVSQGVSITPTTVILGNNFQGNFILQETKGSPITFESIVLAILNSDGTHLVDMQQISNITIPANGTYQYNSQQQWRGTDPPGTYKAVARGKVQGGNWFDFTTTGSGVNNINFNVAQIALSVSPSYELDFGNVEIGQSKSMNITITNTTLSTANLTVEPIIPTAPFQIINGQSLDLSPGSSKKFDFTFTPTNTQSYSQNWSFTHNAGNISSPWTIILKGNGTSNLYSISGKVTDANSIGISSVTMTLSGSQNSTQQTDNNGNYTFSNLTAGGNYTVKPTKTNYTFSPVNKQFNSLSSNQTANFVGTKNSQQTFNVTINTKPQNLDYIVDGITYHTTKTFTLSKGTNHTIQAVTPQLLGQTTKYIFSSWSDFGSNSHTITISSDTTFTANFQTFYQLSINANPSNGGSTVPSGLQWVLQNDSRNITATANSGYNFSNWSGDTSSTNPSINLFMDRSKSITANFNQISNSPGNWQIVKTDPTSTFLSSYFVNATDGWVVGNNVILKTNDGGQTWQSQFTSSLSTQFNDLYFSDLLNGWAGGIGGNSGVIYNTTDGGNNWNIQYNGGSDANTKIYSISGIDENHIYIATSKGLLYTLNGGSVWQTIQIKTFLKVKFVNLLIGWAISMDGDVLKTEDGGQTWVTKYSTGNTGSFMDIEIFGKNIWAGGGMNGAKLLHSSDNGNTWELLSGPFGPYRSIKFIDSNYGWIVGEVGIYRTSDGGINWAKAFNPQNNLLFNVDFKDGVGYSVGYKNILKYVDTTIVATIVNSSPSGLQVKVDNVNYNSPHLFNWLLGTKHLIDIVSDHIINKDTQFVFNSWNDGITQPHFVNILSTFPEYIANYDRQFNLTINALPTNGGSTVPSGQQWVLQNDSRNITATANSGYDFSNWSGDTSSTNPSINLFMDRPKSITANFNQVNSQLFSINGKITDSGSNGISDVTLVLTGTSTADTITDVNGNYSFNNLINGTYQITPSKNGYSFNPKNISVTINNNSLTNQNFTALKAASPNWYYTITGINHIILIPLSSNPQIDGIPLSNGDYIGVFYDSSGVLASAGYSIWDGAKNIVVTAWGDDTGTPNKDGFANNEVFKWKIWRASDQKTFNANAEYLTGSTYTNTDKFTVDGISGVSALYAVTKVQQSINLNDGWQIISSYIDPEKTDIDSIFKSIKNDLIIMKNGTGGVYWPAVNVNSIGKWNSIEGYQLKMQNSSVLTISGTQIIPESKSFTIPQGWSILSYLRNQPMAIEQALNSIKDKIIMVKSGKGLIYWPDYQINTIGNLNPGEGYQIKMKSSTSFTYPANSKTNITLSKRGFKDSDIKSFYPQSTITDNNAVILLKKETLSSICKPSDEIAVFDSKGFLVGKAIYEGKNLAITVFGDDITTTVKDGMSIGEKFRLKLYSKSLEKEFTLNNVTWLDNNDKYNVNGIFYVKKLSDFPTLLNGNDDLFVHQNYPNPFNPVSVISYQLNKPQALKVSLYNSIGQLVKILLNESQPAGQYQIEINGTNLSSGVYFVMFQTEIETKYLKIILMK